jgi:hypothetical protein
MKKLNKHYYSIEEAEAKYGLKSGDLEHFAETESLRFSARIQIDRKPAEWKMMDGSHYFRVGYKK